MTSLAASALTARAAESPAAAESQAKAAIAQWDTGTKGANEAQRARLLKHLIAVDHPLVTARLHALSEDAEADGVSRTAAFDALAARAETDATVAPRIAKWVERASKDAAESLAKGDFGVPVDKKSGQPKRGAEAEAAVRKGVESGKAVAAGLRVAVKLGWKPKDPADTLRPFLQSPYDDVAVQALAMVGAWKVADNARDVAQLFRMYPAENRWETGSVVHSKGTNASAQAAWAGMYGHPLKQRARPEVFRAMMGCIESLTGAKCATPEEFEKRMRDASPRAAKR